MRFEHWERRLAAIVDKYSRLPHEWGRCDCTTFAAEAVWCSTQKDPAAPWRRKYSDEAGAMALIAAHGGLEAMIEHALARAGIRAERIAPAFAQRGDLCLMGGEGPPAVGICVGAEIAGKSIAGLERRPLSAATVVWAIR